MSTTIRLDGAPSEPAPYDIRATHIKVYDPGVAGTDLVIDLTHGDGEGVHHVGVAGLTKDEALTLARAILREAGGLDVWGEARFRVLDRETSEREFNEVFNLPEARGRFKEGMSIGRRTIYAGLYSR